MAKKTSELESAVRTQAKSLDPAQREFVLAEFEHYKWNEKQIEQLEGQYEAATREIDNAGDIPPKERKLLVDQRGSLFRQRHQLVAEQGTLFAHIMKWLKGTAVEQSELDRFLEG